MQVDDEIKKKEYKLYIFHVTLLLRVVGTFINFIIKKMKI